MGSHACETCRMRHRYEQNPTSFFGRLWLWHTKWCPGWKAYVASLTEEDRKNLLESMRKHQT
ncbi:MAG: hypothetical protein IT364_18740 [Candidatus Hydrogenedentes bacterium]|nr:hypothetical protein [Candidatus Hydrogenedentota bacterium]